MRSIRKDCFQANGMDGSTPFRIDRLYLPNCRLSTKSNSMGKPLLRRLRELFNTTDATFDIHYVDARRKRSHSKPH